LSSSPPPPLYYYEEGEIDPYNDLGSFYSAEGDYSYYYYGEERASQTEKVPHRLSGQEEERSTQKSEQVRNN